jgi:hypothetical protein
MVHEVQHVLHGVGTEKALMERHWVVLEIESVSYWPHLCV